MAAASALAPRHTDEPLRFLPYHLIRFSQLAAVVVTAGLAMAAAPQAIHAAADPAGHAADMPITPPNLAVAEPAGDPVQILAFIKPVAYYPINSHFGHRHLQGESRARMHQGIDIAAPIGTVVMASASGVVTATGYDGGYGNYVEILHPNGLRTFYAHLSRIEVRRGHQVGSGDTIGRVGNTGYSTGPHLHFEVRRGATKLNPARYIGREFAIRAPLPEAERG